MNVRLQRSLEKCLSAFRITPGQYVALSHLRSQHKYSAADLARTTGVSPQSIGEIITALQASGMIVREADEQNPRIRRISLTLEGLDTLACIDEEVDELESRLFSAITPPEVRIVRSSMIALLNKLSSPEF
jgi:DNA-binding MarR family transcriptional regulator